MLEIIMFGLGAWLGYYFGKNGSLPEFIQVWIDKVFNK